MSRLAKRLEGVEQSVISMKLEKALKEEKIVSKPIKEELFDYLKEQERAETEEIQRATIMSEENQGYYAIKGSIYNDNFLQENPHK